MDTFQRRFLDTAESIISDNDTITVILTSEKSVLGSRLPAPSIR